MDDSLEERLFQIEEKCRSPFVQSTITTIRDLQSRGINTFTRDEWMHYTGLNAIKARDACDYMLSHKLVINISLTQKRALYAFVGSQEALNHLALPSEPVYGANAEPVPDTLIYRLREMASPNACERDRRISGILLDLYEKGVYSFSYQEVEREFHMTRNTCANALRSALNLGLLSREPGRNSMGHYYYSFNRKPIPDIRSDGLTLGQRMVLTSLYITFKNHHFSTQEGANVCHLKKSGFIFHAVNFVERGILAIEKELGQVNCFVFVTNPHKNPECFVNENSTKHHPASSMPATAPIPMAAASA